MTTSILLRMKLYAQLSVLWEALSCVRNVFGKHDYKPGWDSLKPLIYQALRDLVTHFHGCSFEISPMTITLS